MSALDYSAYGGGKYVYLPTIKGGETIDVHIREIREIRTGLDKFHFHIKEDVKDKDGNKIIVNDKPIQADKSLNYHIECELMDGKILSVTSLAAFIQIFVKNKIQDGEHLQITHRDKGVWEIVKL